MKNFSNSKCKSYKSKGFKFKKRAACPAARSLNVFSGPSLKSSAADEDQLPLRKQQVFTLAYKMRTKLVYGIRIKKIISVMPGWHTNRRSEEEIKMDLGLRELRRKIAGAGQMNHVMSTINGCYCEHLDGLIPVHSPVLTDHRLSENADKHSFHLHIHSSNFPSLANFTISVCQVITHTVHES